MTGFLGLDIRQGEAASARYAVLPIPYEGTATYKSGTAGGPAAILDASRQVELFDEELHAEFISAGIVTCAPIPPADDPGEQMRRVGEAARPIIQAGKFLLSLGGEHSITAPLVAACAAEYGPITVLQIDAHADLRDSYEGSIYSHACVMRRVLEVADGICQVGIRSFCREEYLACGEQVSAFITPAEIAEDAAWIDRALAMLGRYLGNVLLPNRYRGK